jgi:diadenosine tetraphosphate (Ap4A) HIT family hydrolase
MDERQFVCSHRFTIVPESHVHVVPGFNETLRAYVTSYRCDECWLPTLDETASRLAASDDEEEIASICVFLERYGTFILEARRGDPLPVIKQILLRTIEMMKSDQIRLSPGHCRDETRPTVKTAEELGEAAYEAMCDAHPRQAKDFYEAARAHFAKAIADADAAGRGNEIDRLTARLDHIARVYNHQFRGIGY